MFIRLLASEALVCARRPLTAVCLLVAALSGSLAVAATTMSRGTAYGPPVALAFAALVGGLAGLVLAAVIGAALGGDDYDLQTQQELHLAGLPRVSLFLARIVLAAVSVVAVPLVAVAGGACTLVGVLIAGHPVAPETSTLTAAFQVRLVAVALMSTSFSGLAAFALAAYARSRVVGLIIWLGVLMASLYLAHPVGFSSPLRAIFKILPCGPLFAAALGEGNYLTGGLEMTTWQFAASYSAWTVFFVAAAAWAWLYRGLRHSRSGVRRRVR